MPLPIRSLALLGAILVAGCGGDDTKAPAPIAATAGPAATVPAPVTTPAVTTPAETATVGPAPATTTPTTTTTAAPPPETDCNKLGINRALQQEGACTHDNIAVYVANRGTTVPLAELKVRLNGVGIQPAGQSPRVYATASVTITNNLLKTVAFDPNGDQTALVLGHDRFGEDLAVDSNSSPVRRWRGLLLKPGEPQTVTIVYAIPKRLAVRLASGGSVFVTQFSDSGRATPRKRIAILRTYR